MKARIHVAHSSPGRKTSFYLKFRVWAGSCSSLLPNLAWHILTETNSVLSPMHVDAGCTVFNAGAHWNQYTVTRKFGTVLAGLIGWLANGWNILQHAHTIQFAACLCWRCQSYCWLDLWMKPHTDFYFLFVRGSVGFLLGQSQGIDYQWQKPWQTKNVGGKLDKRRTLVRVRSRLTSPCDWQLTKM